MSTIVQGLKSPNYRSNCVVNPYVKYKSIMNRVTDADILFLFILIKYQSLSGWKVFYL